MKITSTMSAIAAQLSHEARWHHFMEFRLANALLTGKIDHDIVKYAEMVIDIYKKEEELAVKKELKKK